MMNSLYWHQGAVHAKQSTPSKQYFAACYGTDYSPIGTQLKPGTPSYGTGPLPTQLLPFEGGFLGDDTRGNLTGDIRVTGIELCVEPLGTLVDAGGEVFLLHDHTAGGIAARDISSVVTSPRTIVRSISRNQPVSFHIIPESGSQDFQHIHQWGNVSDGPADLQNDPAIFGMVSSFGDGATDYGFDDAPKGWDTLLHIQAAGTNNFRITVRCSYEGVLRKASSGTPGGGPFPSFALPLTEVVAANPLAHALVHTTNLLHRTAQEAAATTTETPSVWHSIAKAATHVLPHIFEGAAGAFLATG